MRRKIAALVLATAVSIECLAAIGPAEAVLFGSQSDLGETLYVIDPTTGAGTPVGGIGAGVNGIAIQPGTGTLFGATEGSTGSSLPADSLVTIKTTPGGTLGTIVGSFMLPRFVSIGDLAFDSLGDLYGWSTAAGNDLYKINLGTGQATLVGPSGFSARGGSGFAINADGDLYLAAEGTKGPLRTVNKLTGATVAGPTLSGFDLCGCPGGEGIVGLAFNGLTLYGVTNLSDHLITINVDTGEISDIGPAVGPDIGIEGLAFTTQVPNEVPEPAGLIMVVSGVAALVARRRLTKRRRASA